MGEFRKTCILTDRGGLLSSEQEDEGCDATKLNRIPEAGNIKKNDEH